MSEPIPLDYATPTPAIPGALKVVAWLFIISGVFSILQVILDLTNSRLTLTTGILGIFIGPGLLKLRRGWRTCALVMLWFGIIFTPVALLFMLNTSGSITVNVMGLSLGTAPPAIGLLFAAVSLALVIWEYRVLVRADVRQLFGLG